MKKLIIILMNILIVIQSFSIYRILFRWFIYTESIISILLCAVDGFILSISVLELIRNIKS